MTTEDYMTRCRSAHQRLDILRKQIERHMKNASPSVSADAVSDLFWRMGQICDELSELDKEYRGNA